MTSRWRNACASRARRVSPAWKWGGAFRSDPKLMLPVLKTADVTLCGGWFSGTLVDESLESNQKRIQPMIDLFKAVNAPCIVYGEVGRSIQGDRSKPLGTKPKLTGDEMKAYGRRVTEFAEWVEAQGMPLVYHHHMAAVVETEAGTRFLHAPLRHLAAVRCRPHGVCRRRRAALHRQASQAHHARPHQGRAHGRDQQARPHEGELPRCGGEGRLHGSGRWLAGFRGDRQEAGGLWL